MALTYRTGSDGKDSALTINELDNNFRYFTGSHSITGSLTINGDILITGSIIPEGNGVHNLGSATNPFQEIFVSNNSIIFVSGSTTSSFGVDSSGSMSGSFDGDYTGSFTGSMSGSFDGDYTGSFTGSIDSQFNTGSCLIGCVGSVPPIGSRPEGTFEFMVSASVQTMFVYLGGAWRSSSLS